MGEMQVPADVYYGAQTARAIENFPISDLRFPKSFIRALGLIKKHGAATNAALGLLDEKIAAVIEKAAQEVIDGIDTYSVSKIKDGTVLMNKATTEIDTASAELEKANCS